MSMSSLERSILTCQDRDANGMRHTLAVVFGALFAKHDPLADPMEAAKLACQARDIDGVRNASADLANALKPHGKAKSRDVNGAAHA